MSDPDRDSRLESIEDTLRSLIVNELGSTDVSIEEIEPETTLVGRGAGLDSVDVLDLTLLIQDEFGVKFQGTGEQNREHFETLRSLARYVQNELGDA
ncbi:MAG: phosphopantetheine-binding protein [bacterium]